MSVRKKILIVDDDPFVLTLLEKAIIDDNQHEVMKANNGIEALELAEQHKFDLIISDIIMPEMDGVEFIQKLRESHKDIPVIAISGGGENCDGQDYINFAGYFADDVLKKPFKKDELMDAIDLAINDDKVDIYALF